MAGELEEKFLDGAWYQVRVEGAKTDESTNTGTPGIVLKLMVTEGEMAGNFLTDDHWISKASMERHRKEFMDAFDYDIAKEDLDGVETLVGREVAARVRIEEWPVGSGKKRPKVDRLRKKGVGEGLPASKRIASFFGRSSADEEWEKDKKF